MKMADSSSKVQKTLWEMETLLVTSNFSFSPSVFKRPVLQTRENQGLFGKGLIATFQLPSAASLNLEWSQNGVFGNGLISVSAALFSLSSFQMCTLQYKIMSASSKSFCYYQFLPCSSKIRPRDSFGFPTK